MSMSMRAHEGASHHRHEALAAGRGVRARRRGGEAARTLRRRCWRVYSKGAAFTVSSRKQIIHKEKSDNVPFLQGDYSNRDSAPRRRLHSHRRAGEAIRSSSFHSGSGTDIMARTVSEKVSLQVASRCHRKIVRAAAPSAPSGGEGEADGLRFSCTPRRITVTPSTYANLPTTRSRLDRVRPLGLLRTAGYRALEGHRLGERTGGCGESKALPITPPPSASAAGRT